MKRGITILCALTLLFSLCACGQKQVQNESIAPSASSFEKDMPEATSDQPDTNSDTDASQQEKEAGTVTIEITPPEGWTKNEGSVLPVHYMKGTASFMVKTEPFTSATLDEVVTEALDMYQKSFDNLSVVGEAEPSTVDEKDARTLTFTCTVSKMNMKYLYVYLFAADQCYVITFGDLESSFDALAADYEAILNGIRFVAE